jgi:hypothetical protein
VASITYTSVLRVAARSYSWSSGFSNAITPTCFDFTKVAVPSVCCGVTRSS